VTLLLVAVGIVAWTEFSPPRFDHDRVYRIGYGQDAPLHFQNADGQPAGLAVDLVQESARRQGIKLAWHHLEEMGQNDIDLWVLKSVIPDRPSTLYHTEPYLQAESCFLVRADSPVRDLPDLLDGRISFVNYRIHRDTLPRLLASFKPVPTESSRDAVDAMLSGRSDAAYIDQYTLFATLLDGEQVALRVLPTRSPTRNMALGARKPSAAVADAIRSGMQSMVADGSLEKLMQKWIFFPNMTANIIGDIVEKQHRIRWLWTGVTILTLLLLVAVALAVVAQRRKSEWRRSQKKYRELHESMTDAFVRFDLDGRINDINPAFCELVGYTESELMERTDRELTPLAWHTREEDRRQNQIVLRGYSDVHEKEYRHKDGTVFPVESRAFLLRDESGRPAGWWEIVRDITDRRQAEAERGRLREQLAQSQKMEVVGRLAGGVAHDFNNMLQAILGNASLALLDLPADSPARESLQEIRSAADRSVALTSQLLTFARRQATAPKVLDLNEAIERTLQLVRRLIGEGVQLAWQPGAGVWPVRIDPSQLDQILTNLCVNARDAVNGTGRITLETCNVILDPAFCAAHPGIQSGDFVRLSVSDNGTGMTPEVLAHIFEPFYTTKEMNQGTGLGLATVYGIVTQNQGAITVASTPGEGSTFRVFLPRHAANSAPAATPAGQKPPPGRGHETILLVEDEAKVLRISKMMLDGLGYQVLVAATPAEALRTAEASVDPIHLLLTDVIMPGLNGRELAEQLRVRHPAMKCVFMSGYDAKVIAPHGILEDEVNFLQKPFSAEDLAAKIRAALT
jgi:PAS domain S-box-containing protein